MTKFAQLLREEMTSHDLTQQALADAVGIHQGTVGRLMRAEFEPRLLVFCRLVRVLPGLSRVLYEPETAPARAASRKGAKKNARRTYRKR